MRYTIHDVQGTAEGHDVVVGKATGGQGAPRYAAVALAEAHVAVCAQVEGIGVDVAEEGEVETDVEGPCKTVVPVSPGGDLCARLADLFPIIKGAAWCSAVQPTISGSLWYCDRDHPRPLYLMQDRIVNRPPGRAVGHISDVSREGINQASTHRLYRARVGKSDSIGQHLARQSLRLVNVFGGRLQIGRLYPGGRLLGEGCALAIVDGRDVGDGRPPKQGIIQHNLVGEGDGRARCHRTAPLDLTGLGIIAGPSVDASQHVSGMGRDGINQTHPREVGVAKVMEGDSVGQHLAG